MSGFFVFIGFHTFPIMMLSTKQRWRKWERERRKINRWNHSDASLCLSVVLPVMVKAPHCVLHSSSLQSLLHPISPSAPPAVPFTHFSSHNRCVPRPLLKASLKPHPPCSFISLPLNTSVKTSVRKTKGRLTLWAELLNRSELGTIMGSIFSLIYSVSFFKKGQEMWCYFQQSLRKWRIKVLYQNSFAPSGKDKILKKQVVSRRVTEKAGDVKRNCVDRHQPNESNGKPQRERSWIRYLRLMVEDELSKRTPHYKSSIPEFCHFITLRSG